MAERRKMNMEKFASELETYLKDFEWVEPRLTIRCIPAGGLLDGALYKRIGDIALCVYIVLNDDKNEFVSAAKSGMLRLWNKSFEDVYRMAMDNTGDPVIIKMDLMEVANGFFRKIDIDDLDVSDQQYVCVTTDTMTNGAAAIFKPGAAEKLLNGFRTDKLYLSFTSVHEVMVHPAGDIEPEELKEVLNDTYQSCHTGSDFLTSHIYEYTKEYGFQIAA